MLCRNYRKADAGRLLPIPVLAAMFSLLLVMPGSTEETVEPAEQDGPILDIHYVPTPNRLVHRMLEMAGVNEKDYVVDLGSGDGRIVIAAVRDFHARAGYGIDLDPQRVAEARENARQAGVSDRVVFEEGDLFEKDFSEATVLTLYLLQHLNERLRPTILEIMAPGTRVVSHDFDMGDWEPDDQVVVQGSYAFLWVVPARVAGQWHVTLADGSVATLMINQQYQRIDGHLLRGDTRIELSDARLHGDEIQFLVGSDQYLGKVGDGVITSLAGADAVSYWYAQRF